MRKRPLFTGAFVFALVLWFLSSICGVDFFPEKMEAGREVYLTGELLKTEEKDRRVFLFLRHVACAEQEKTVRFHKALLILDRTASLTDRLKPGNVVSATAVCDGFQNARNAGNFDEESYYHSLGIQGKFHVKKDFSVLNDQVSPVRCAMQWVRKKLAGSLDQITGAREENHTGIFLAVLTGDRSALDQETRELYQKSGIAHILAISGLHISFLGMALFSFLRKRLRLSYAAVLSGSAMACFCLMSGESASAVRATLMFLLRLAALKYGKTFDLLSALGLSAILLLLQNPMVLYNTGFLLSFGAVLGLGVLLPNLDNYLVLSGRAFAGRLLTKLKTAALASLSATLATLPVILHSFFEIPVFSVFLNLLAVPLMAMVLESGALGVLLGLASAFFGRLLIGSGVYLISLIELLCGIAVRIPAGLVITGCPGSFRTSLYYAALFLFVLLIKRTVKKKRPEKPLRRAAVFAAALFVLSCIVLCSRTEGRLRMTFFDVDQGDGILIESPSGSVYMIDGGSATVSDLYRYRLESALKWKGVSRIDYAIVTHTDTDHISGLAEMMKKQGAGSISVRNLLLPYIPDSPNYEMLVRTAEEAGVRVMTLREGMRLEDSAVSMECLHPDPGYRSLSVNGYSAVISLTFGDFRALFTGDIAEAEERILISKNILKKYHLLKVSHHGSKFSSSAEFLTLVSPDMAVISAGVGNSYGHPHKDAVERLKAAGAKLYVTAELGEIRIDVDFEGEVSLSHWDGAAFRFCEDWSNRLGAA